MKKALLIGLNYKGTPNELPDCEKDVNDIERLLPKDYAVTKLTSVTAKDFYNLLVQFKSQLTPTDTLLVYYSGHGTQFPSSAEKDGYQEGLVLWTPQSGFEIFKDADLKLLLAAMNCKVILCLDSCFSGGMETLVATYGIPRFKEFAKDKIYKTVATPYRSLARQIHLFACAENQTAQSTGTGGLFTKAILSVLKKGSKPVFKVFWMAKLKCGKIQTPQLILSGGTKIEDLIF